MVLIYKIFVTFVSFSWLVFGDDPPETVDKLELSKYNGSWYQVLYNQYVQKSQQPNQMCIVTKYNAVNETSMLATQYSRTGNPFGPEMKTKSQIERPDKKIPGIFQLLASGAPYPEPYLVIKLGPVNDETNLYEYAVVTDSDMLSLYVLAREVRRFDTHYSREVMDFCHDNGFSSYYNQPIVSPQPAACRYYDDEELVDERTYEDNFPQVIQL